MATDGHVISPLFFPGGDIGCLAVHGTVNDVAMSGATPLYLTASFILEEGLRWPTCAHRRIHGGGAREAGVPIVTGDTKVVEQGKGDGVFISTTGIGVVPPGLTIDGRRRAGDAVLVSGTLGEHGVAVLSQRESLEFETAIVSDSAALHTWCRRCCRRARPRAAACCATPRAAAWPPRSTKSRASRRWACCCARPHPRAAAGGRRLRTAGPGPAVRRQRGQAGGHLRARPPSLLAAMRAHPLGRGRAHRHRHRDANGFVQMDTRFGGRRVVDWLSGEQLPRIC
jgi:hydrogenase expression/formation protein HypE